MRFRNGDYQTRTSDETRCKDRCVQNPTCIGVDWNTDWDICFLLYDSNASPCPENGYRHWRIIRLRSPLTISQVTLVTTTPLGSATPTVNTEVHPTQNFSIGDIYSWQPVQNNTRMKTGDFRKGIKNETACKAECLKDVKCAGIYWYDLESMCNFHTDCNSPLVHEDDFRLWIIQKYTPTSGTCQNLIRRPVAENVSNLSVSCDPRDNLEKGIFITGVSALAVVSGGSTVVIIALLFNTCRLNRKIRKCAFMIADVPLAQQNGQPIYEGNKNCPNPSTGYMEIIGTRTSRPSDNENLYDDIDEALRQ